jgi:hypothetical protein
MHDELVFEVPEGEVEKTLHVVTKVMVDVPMPACHSRGRCKSRLTPPTTGTTRTDISTRLIHPSKLLIVLCRINRFFMSI